MYLFNFQVPFWLWNFFDGIIWFGILHTLGVKTRECKTLNSRFYSCSCDLIPPWCVPILHLVWVTVLWFMEIKTIFLCLTACSSFSLQVNNRPSLLSDVWIDETWNELNIIIEIWALGSRFRKFWFGNHIPYNLLCQRLSLLLMVCWEVHIA